MDTDSDGFVSPENSVATAYSVASLLRSLNTRLAETYGAVHVLGEIQTIKRAASGHCYIELKDEHEDAVLQTCFFRAAQRGLAFVPKVGDCVEVVGRLNVYAARGQLSFVIEAMKPAGEGALYAKFVALKNKLLAEGLFDESRKKPLPLYPRRVGIVTSEHGAALQDVLRTIALHAPQIELVLYPASVQGAEAEAELIAALRTADARREVDCLLLVRGGGSLTDLWTFNSEPLARQIAQMGLPVLSGIGHETDTTIADFAADWRGATPTAAAMRVCESWQKVAQRLQSFHTRLFALANAKLREAQAALRGCADPARVLRDRLEREMRRLDETEMRLIRCPERLLASKESSLTALWERYRRAWPRLEEQRAYCEALQKRLALASAHRFQSQCERLRSVVARLEALELGRILARGFCVARDETGAVCSGVGALKVGDRLDFVFADGSVASRIEQIRHKN